MPSDNSSDDHNSENAAESWTARTRREVMALAGLTSLTWTSGSQWLHGSDSGSRSADVSGSAADDLDLDGGDIVDVSDIEMVSDRPTLKTPGTGTAGIEIRDTTAGEWSMRATEGSGGDPGAVEFNAPLRGPRPDDDSDPSLDIEGAVHTDELTVESWQIVDVSERGIEPGSDDDLGAFIADHFGQSDVSGAVYYLPEGTYRWETPVTARSFDVFGIVGQPQARVRCTNTELPYFLSLGTDSPGNADAFFARNLTFDVRTDDVAASPIIAAVDEYLEIDNCSLVGELDRIVPPFYSIQPTLLTETGQGFVRVTMGDGSFYDPDLNEQEHPMGIAIERQHRGYLVIENSAVEGFINNGIYSAGHNGKVAIRNTTIKNCGAGMLRLGDGDYAYKCELVNDDAEDRGYSYAALWVTAADHAVADSIEIVSHQRTPSELVRVNGDVDHCSLSNVDIESHANQYLCEFTGSDTSLGPVVASNWTITDTGSAESNAHLGRIARPNVILENWAVDIDPSGTGKRHGIIIDAPWVDVQNCSFDHSDGGLAVLLDDDADYLRLKDCDFKRGQLYQYGRATNEDAIVVDNRFIDGTTLAGEQINWTTRGASIE